MEQFYPIAVMVIFFGIAYFLMIRPQRKSREAHKELVLALSRGDNVVTAGGICGEVKKVNDDTIILETEGGTTIKMRKQSVVEKE
jgi:preprotein translocase subunit YajC